VSRVTVDKCDQCGFIFTDAAKYEKHLQYHADVKEIAAAFPPVNDKGCDFANGGWSVPRSADWLAKYGALISAKVGKDASAPAFSYGWFRTLDDGGHVFYGLACRWMNVCKTCYREWGQPYYANNCNHSASKDRPA
jgi:hypothetical protein